MTKKPTLSETGSKVTEIANAASKVEGVVPRALDEMPKFVHHKGAKEIAVLTVAAREQAFTFKPVMEALQLLASSDIDWSLDYLVAHELVDDSKIRGPSFNWKNAPWKRYASFKDFYKRELEPTWGKWETLQHTWSEVVEGKITEEEGRRRIVLGKHGGDRRSQQAKADQPCDNEKGTRLKDGEYGTRDHILARLDKKHPELATKVRAHKMSHNAAAIEAGFRKKRASRKMTMVKRLLKLWAKATDDERAEFLSEVQTRGD